MIWEYRVIDKWGVPLTGEELNKYGADGWELITVIESYSTMQGAAEKATRYYIFKRPRT